ncbi:uncharacterized protein LOC125652295 isoform X2 [Ostrea edulis]|uniref:uncharacterized protein LOC125652295 isoform X2 n=1 Tax=Ostrea edulis TaxID=37623 RepID=UPI0020951CD6|nr:uncharacterized protein LOC125652295 isoform X2 [Ostrea edulis]
MGTVGIIILLMSTFCNVLLGNRTVVYIIRNKIRCIAQNCPLNQTFEPCTKDNEKDNCKPCLPGTFMPDRINTADWNKSIPGCIRNDCNDCDPIESILGNKDTCGKTERAHCVCDRERLYYGENDPGPVTSCTKKEGDLCDRIGVQLNQRGECEPCPPGTEKNSNDYSLCKKITVSQKTTTPEPETKLRDTESTTHPNTTSAKKPPPTPNGTTQLPPSNSSDNTTIVIAVSAVIVPLVLCLVIFCCLRSRRHRQYSKYQTADDGKCCGIQRDSSSMNSSQNSEKDLLVNENIVKQGEKEGYPIKPMQKVMPMISVDESVKNENEEELFDSLDAAFPNNRTREDHASGGREQIACQQSGWRSQEYDYTEVKFVYSPDETDLKVPYRNSLNPGVDLDRTRVKTVYSEETEVKQIAGGQSSRILDNDDRPVMKSVVKIQVTSSQSVSQGVTPVQAVMKSVGKIPVTSSQSVSQGVPPVQAVMKSVGEIPVTSSQSVSQGVPPVQVFPSPSVNQMRQGDIPQTMVSTSSPANQRREGSVPQTMAIISSPSNQRREGSVPQLVASISSQSNQIVVLPSSAANQRSEVNTPQMMVSPSSPLNKGELCNFDAVQQNCIQPTVCQPTKNSESLNSDALFGSGSAVLENEMKNTSNNIAHVHHNWKTDMKQSSSGMHSSQKNFNGELENSNNVSLCDFECQTETTKGHSNGRTISYGGLIISETDENSDVLVSSQPTSDTARQINVSTSYHPHIEQEGMKQSSYEHLAESSQHHPDQSSQHHPDQSSQSLPFYHCTGARPVSAAENSTIVPIGASVQNSHILSVENSGTSSGYGTARRSEMGTFIQRDEGKANQTSIMLSEPPIVNSLLRSKSRNSDPHGTEKHRSSDSLGLSRLQNAPLMNLNSSDEVAQIEIQQVPPLIKGGLDRARASLERRHENLQHHALDHAVVQQSGGVESGYCS